MEYYFALLLISEDFNLQFFSFIFDFSRFQFANLTKVLKGIRIYHIRIIEYIIFVRNCVRKRSDKKH